MNKPHVAIPPNHPNPPEPHEVDVAWILAHHYCTTVEFLIPIDGYKIKTPDIVLNGLLFEIKCVFGKSKNTIKTIIKRAVKQSKYIVLDTRKINLSETYILKTAKKEFAMRPRLRKLILITRDKKVLELSR